MASGMLRRGWGLGCLFRDFFLVIASDVLIGTNHL